MESPMSLKSFNTNVLPDPQKRLWDKLHATPSDFVLYGGTALALRLGHRESIDFDFFSKSPFAPDMLKEKIPYLEAGEAIQSKNNTLTCILDLKGSVRVSFFGGLPISSVHAPDRADGPGIMVASLLDIAATKVKTVQSRSNSKDYIDIDALLRAGINLEDAFGAAVSVYGPTFQPLLTLKALSFYGDGDLDQVRDDVRERLRRAIIAVDLHSIPVFEAREHLAIKDVETNETGYEHGF